MLRVTSFGGPLCLFQVAPRPLRPPWAAEWPAEASGTFQETASIWGKVGPKWNQAGALLATTEAWRFTLRRGSWVDVGGVGPPRPPLSQQKGHSIEPHSKAGLLLPSASASSRPTPQCCAPPLRPQSPAHLPESKPHGTQLKLLPCVQDGAARVPPFLPPPSCHLAPPLISVSPFPPL